jgi:GNAT superfamily N-acetyltransferase
MSVAVAQQITVRRLREEEQPLLEDMYATFTPPEAALGLPPRDPARRHTWLATLESGINLAAFVEGKLAGHLVLMSTGHLAEMAVFVHQEFRRQGVGAALVQTAVEEARARGLLGLWVLLSSDNSGARAGLRNIGFETAWEGMGEVQMVLRLKPVAQAFLPAQAERREFLSN